MAWRELPDEPHDSEGPPSEMRTATVIGSAVLAPPPPAFVDGEGTCKVDADCVVASSENCCASACPPGHVVSTTIDTANQAKMKRCDGKTVCPPPGPCPQANIMLRPVCVNGSCKGEEVPVPKGTVPGSSDTVTLMQPQFAKCYQAALTKDPHTEGSTRVVAKIDADGSYLSVTPTQTDGLSDDLVGCLVAAVKAIRFQRPINGVGTVIIPIRLSK